MSKLDIEKEHINVLLSVSGVFTFCRANDDKQDLSLALTATEKLCSELLSSDRIIKGTRDLIMEKMQ